MKTDTELHVAVWRSLMRTSALLYRQAICPTAYWSSWGKRINAGERCLRDAIARRNEALRYIERLEDLQDDIRTLEGWERSG